MPKVRMLNRPAGLCSFGLLFVLLVGNASPSHAATKYFRVKNVPPGQIVWMRSGPAISFKRVSHLPYNARHILTYRCAKFETEEWCEVRQHGFRGWVSKRYLVEEKTRKV